MVVTERPRPAVPLTKGPFTYAHLRHLRRRIKDRNRYEIIGGVLEVTPAPSIEHQWVAGEFYWRLSGYVRERGAGIVLVAPLDVILSETDVVEPDLLYLTAEQLQRVAHHGVQEPPTLVVEVLSPSTLQRDRGRKRELYERMGVPHYWLVHPLRDTLDAFTLRDDRYAPETTAAADGEFRPQFPGLVIRLSEIWFPSA